MTGANIHPVASLGQMLFGAARPETRALLRQADLELGYNARGALYALGRELASGERREVLLPAYHCPSGVTPLIEAGLTPVFYRIRRDLSVDFEDLLSKVGPRTCAVLAIHFFGFATDLAPLQGLRRQGIAIIEDWSHSFLQGDPPQLPAWQGDFQVFSFWKLVPSVVGGGLRRRVPAMPARPARPGVPLRESAVRLKGMLESVLAHSPHRRAHALFQRLEAWRLGLRRALRPSSSSWSQEAPDASLNGGAALRGEDRYPFDLRLAMAAMPATARRVLESTDLRDVARRRRANFKAYAARLAGSNSPVRPLYASLPEGSCPWVFPVLLADRDAIDHRWRAAGVALYTFGIYLHSALELSSDKLMVEDAKFLAREILCLAIHQDLTTGEIARFADTILCQDSV